MANTLRKLDPQASQAALFGAEVRALRVGHGLSLAALGRMVHVSGDLLGKIEKAERRPQPDLIQRLDAALKADGRVQRLGNNFSADRVERGVAAPILTPASALPSLRRVVDAARADDHEMGAAPLAAELLAHATAAEKLTGRVGRRDQPQLRSTIAEAYQLVGWMSFDAGRPGQAHALFTTSRRWAERVGDTALTAFILGPNLSFTATYGGRPDLGVELAYAAWGWARRTGNGRLVAFTLAIGARAHARLGETKLCLDLLDQAETALDRHVPGDDPRWLAVLDHAALAGHRGSCLRDLGSPQRALASLAEQEARADPRFLRNRVLWHLDGVDALLDQGDVERACGQLHAVLATLGDSPATPRVLRRFDAVALRLRAQPTSRAVGDVLERLHLAPAPS